LNIHHRLHGLTGRLLVIWKYNRAQNFRPESNSQIREFGRQVTEFTVCQCCLYYILLRNSEFNFHSIRKKLQFEGNQIKVQMRIAKLKYLVADGDQKFGALKYNIPTKLPTGNISMCVFWRVHMTDQCV
jgi:hypothetical protein